jgi:hypothetical protein
VLLATCGGIAAAADSKPDTPADKPAKDAPAQAPADAGAEWEKLLTRIVHLQQPRQILTPGLFDPELQKGVALPKDPAPVDTGLPHSGKDKDDKPFPAIMAKVQQSFVWIDFNADGKPGNDETRPVGLDGLTSSVTCELHYDDGTPGQYTFCLKPAAEREKLIVLRCVARAVEFQNHKIVLLDDNGNGKYNDVGEDAVIIDDQPPCFLGKYINLGGKFYELLVHAAGAAIELRPAPKLDLGTVDMFEKYKPPQKSENLKIHMLIITGPEGSFSFDERHRSALVPAGAYDLAFGLFERAKETVFIKKGEKTSFTVLAGKPATPAWGGPVKAKFEVSSDEKGVAVSVPAFRGAATEQYFPENYRVIPVQASIAQVFTDRMKLERKVPFGTKRFDVLPNGDLAPLVFKPFRTAADEYEIVVDYNSGILGGVIGREHFQYTPQKKVGDKKP